MSQQNKLVVPPAAGTAARAGDRREPTQLHGFVKFLMVWFPVLTFLALAGIWLGAQLDGPNPAWVDETVPSLRDARFGAFLQTYLVGFAVTSIVVAAVYETIYTALRLYDKWDDHDATINSWCAALVGSCERIMYPAALLMGQGEFVGVWLALKVAVQWKRWSGEVTAKERASDDDLRTMREEQNRDRRRYEAFLIGTAISLLAGTTLYFLLRRHFELG